MHEHWKEAKERYEAIEIPEDLSFATESAVRRGNRRYLSRRTLRRGWGAGLAACVCFCLLVNGSPAFASAVSSLPQCQVMNSRIRKILS